jgi:hypothetical protein
MLRFVLFFTFLVKYQQVEEQEEEQVYYFQNVTVNVFLFLFWLLLDMFCWRAPNIPFLSY